MANPFPSTEPAWGLRAYLILIGCAADRQTGMLVVVGRSRHVGLRFTSLALHMSQASEYSCWRFCGRCSLRTAQK